MSSSAILARMQFCPNCELVSYPPVVSPIPVAEVCRGLHGVPGR